MFSKWKGYRRLKEERTEDEIRNIRTIKTTGPRRGMGRVAPSMGDILKMKRRRRVTIKSNFVL